VEPSQALTQFQSINRTRIERLRELAPKSQQVFFDLLALLFHINAESLPAYISSDTPAGFVDFQPNDNL
jgi:adenylate cyclase class 1